MKVENCINMMFSVAQPWERQACLDYADKTGISDCFYSNRLAFRMHVKEVLLNRLGRITSVKMGNPFYLGFDAEKIDAEKISENKQNIGEIVSALCILLCLNGQFECHDELRR